MKKLQIETSQLFGLPIVRESFTVVVEKLTSYQGKTLLVATPNPEQIVLSTENSEFKANLHEMDLLLPDGIGIIFASHILDAADKAQAIDERITGIDVVEKLLKFASENNKKVLVIGGRGYSADKLNAEENKTKQTWDWLEGYSNIALPTPQEEKAVTAHIEKLKPDFVFIAFGAPFQENWLVTHRSVLEKSGVKVAMAVGGTFDMITGQLERAPGWMQTLYLEWLYRLYQEPWRWRRQLKLFTFGKVLVQELLK